MSWNVHGLPFLPSDTGNRLDLIGREIRWQAPDIVFLQEVWLSAYLRRIHKMAGAAYEVLDEPRDLLGWPRGGLVILIARRDGWAVEQASFHRYHDSAPWWRLTEGDGVSGKGFLTLSVSRGQHHLTLIDTHLQSQYLRDRQTYKHVRYHQLAQLTKYLSLYPTSLPVLIGGDFNTGPTEKLYYSGILQLGQDLTTKERNRCNCGTQIDSIDGRRTWIDYVLSRGLTLYWSRSDTRIIRNTAADDPYSDHDGLVVRVVYRKVERSEGRAISRD